MDNNIALIIKCDPVDEAKRLRKLGLSYREIAKKINISASSARNYTKDIILNQEEKEKLLSYRRKKTNNTIVLNYKADNISITGKIKINYPSKNTNPDIKKIIIHIIENSTI